MVHLLYHEKLSRARYHKAGNETLRECFRRLEERDAEDGKKNQEQIRERRRIYNKQYWASLRIAKQDLPELKRRYPFMFEKKEGGE